MNGTTWFDRTNYFETVPTTALDMALWMESDRMGHLLGAIGQPELDTQRGVVQNEKRQGENRPTAAPTRTFCSMRSRPTIRTTTTRSARWPISTPPRWTTSSNWFRGYYGAANTTVVLAGDITPAVAKQKMLRSTSATFRPARRCRASSRGSRRAALRRAARRQDHVAQVRIYREWNVPQLGDADNPLLDLAAKVLGGGKTSRLYQRLVYKDKLVDDVSVERADVRAGQPVRADRRRQARR